LSLRFAAILAACVLASPGLAHALILNPQGTASGPPMVTSPSGFVGVPGAEAGDPAHAQTFPLPPPAAQTCPTCPPPQRQAQPLVPPPQQPQH